MNEDGSAGGGQQGHVPAPPAVIPDRRSNYSGDTQMSDVGSAVSTTQMSPIGSVEKISQSDQNFIETDTPSTRSSPQHESDDLPNHQNIQLVESTETQQQNTLINSVCTDGDLTPTQSAVCTDADLTPTQSAVCPDGNLTSTQSAVCPDGNLTPTQSAVCPEGNLTPTQSAVCPDGNLTPTQSAVCPDADITPTQSEVCPDGDLTPTQSAVCTDGNLTPTQSAVNSENIEIIPSDSNLVTSTTPSSPNQSSELTLSPAKKRLKLSDDSDIIIDPNDPNDPVELEKAILEYNFAKLKNIKYRHSEYVAELFFLQSNGNMMEYPTWRKKSNTQQFITFMKSHRLDPPPLEEPEQISRQIQPTTLPIGAEIKIPGVGATPVAVSTTLPAAVVQLSQQGNIPGRPQGGRHGMVFGQIPAPPMNIGSPPVPLVPGGTPIVPDVPNDKRKLALPVNAQPPSSGPHEQFSVKARQEVYVLQRVSELQREGLWMERRLPKVQEPQRPKAHWDYLLEEMAWMATDFAQERKWKKAAAKKCARMVQKHFNDKALAAQKAEKAQEIQLKRIASFIAKEIKIFWSDVEKLVSFKQQQKLEEKRKKAFDQHLNYIVGQTEKFSMQLAEGMNKPANDASAAASLNSSRRSSPKHRNASDDEFEPDIASDDDEETIAKAELEDATNVDDEVAALQKESEMELDAFISGLPKDYLQNRDKIVLSEDDEQSDEQSDEEFKVSGDSDDDEDTIMEQEQNENKDDHQMEIDELNAENNMTLEELMAKYKSAPQPSKMEVDSDDDSTDKESSEESDQEDQSDNEEDLDNLDKDNLNESFGLKSLLEEESNKQSQADKDDLINDAAAIAESIQPKGNTLSSTNVVTPVPVLLKHTLREYQHIGLDWLVTMHDQKLNGILADEMGLGKTIQTISLLAHLACVKGNWGPHLIVVPSSVMLNWEMEFKKWCPGFKILTYYGTHKERKQKRIGWTKINAFHICITSYKLVIQDHQSFRRKKWKYLILDEAQNIKNFKSQRWQLLLNFSTEQRLLLTGTPLQNNLMELWSLMHFLMPHVFQSHREFKEWFSNPMTGMIEGNTEYNNSIIQRLHKVLRPFLLRRLKSEVEKQMPKKYEHVVMCRLSNRQRYLYDDFMSRAKTKETLESGNLLSVINVLMQLRKVCNHPNMFETRPTISPFRMDGLILRTTSHIANILDYDPFNHIDLNALNLVLVQIEMCLTAYVAYRIKRLQTPKKLIEEIDSSPDTPPRPPSCSFKMHLTLLASGVQHNTPSLNCVKVGTSPAMKTERTKCVPQSPNLVNKKPNQPIPVNALADTVIPPLTTSTPTQLPNMSLRKRLDPQDIQTPQLTTPIRRQVLLTPSSGGKSSTFMTTPSGQKLTVVKNSTPQRPTFATKGGILTNSNKQQSLSKSLGQQFKHSYTQSSKKVSPILPEEQSEFLIAELENQRKERRIQSLQFLAKLNSRKCDVSPIYGNDLRDTVVRLCSLCENSDNLPWYARSYVHCQHAVMNRDSWSLAAAIKSFEDRTDEMRALFGNFVIFVPAVSAPEPCLTVTHPNPSKVNEELTRERVIRTEMSPKLALLHPIISAMSTQFPDPRLIQYDCGKLQTLDRLLRQLKSGSHRVLIFTQMTRMLDVLEAFLNYHGHIYLRLDGTTRVEQRQILMDRFNNDKRIFVFILSTRSGGVGVNLTGADTVIFYDSDWNPTMDAQAQDRCHRIGQTRDVHIYRLVSEKTIEENILKKANQKRLLGDLAIEGGNFTTAYFKESTIQDLFTVDNNDENASSRLAEVLDRDRDRRNKLQENLATSSNGNGNGDDKTAIGVLESALAAAEDEQDVEATKIASAEVAADLAEFDESIPIEENETPKVVVEVSKAEQEVDNLLSPIERYAMRFVEETGGSWTEQLRSAEAEIEQQKREWEANRLAALRKEEEDAKRAEEEENQLLTYSGVDARNQIWISDNTMEEMPIWGPPTPPQDDNDIYIDYSLLFLYERSTMSESELPPVYVKKEFKRSRVDAGFFIDNRRPLKMRKEDNYNPPRSLFDKPSPALAKLRKDLKLQRYRGIFKMPLQIPVLKQQVPLKPLVEPEGMVDWLIHEDIELLNVIQQLQGLPLNLMLLSPGHTPNWDLVADIINQTSRVYRTAKHCRYRYEAVIVPREEGKLIESPKKQKKTKNPLKAPKNLRTAQLYANDKNISFSKLLKVKYDNIKTAYLKKAPQLKQMLVNPTLRNPKHAAILSDFGVTNYENPLTPQEIIARRVEKMKEKQRSAINNLPELVQAQGTSIPAQIISAQSPTAIIVQQQTPQSQQQIASNLQSVATLVQSPLQGQRSAINISHQQSPQIVKAIVGSPQQPSLIASTVQHIPISQAQQIQHVQAIQQQQQNIVSQSPVSVVLTTPISVMTSVSQQIQPQIVSIQQTVVPSNSAIISQSTGALVQSVTAQQQGTVVSVSQLAGVGTVFTTSGLPTNATVGTLSTSSLRGQRIVTAPGLQEVVLNQRLNTQSPTVVSVSGITGQAFTQAQLQASQLRLAVSGGQQVTGVVTKGIPVNSVTGKPINQATQSIFFRPQLRQQQLKVIHPGQGGPAGTIISGGIVQTASGQTVQLQQQGQKVSVATVGGTAGTPVQMATGQTKTQFVKQVGGKQTITRQATDGEMLIVKRQLIAQPQQQQGGQQKTQLINQSQIFTPSTLQIQQAGATGQPQIATLVKTSVGGAGGTVGMTLSQIKPGQLKATIPNQGPMRQIQIQQPVAIGQHRKTGKMTQITQVTAKPGTSTGIPTQLIVQNSNKLANTVTVQQIQQVIRQPAGGQIVLGKASVGRVIPVTMSSQTARQIQVVSSSALAGNSIRTHPAQPNISTHTIKVAPGTTPQQTQAIFSALHQVQRQNASPVRLQTASGSLVALTVQPQAGNIVVSTQNTGSVDSPTNAIVQTVQQHIQQQQQQQVAVAAVAQQQQATVAVAQQQPGQSGQPPNP